MKSRKVTFSILLIMTLLISTISSTFAFAADSVDYSGAVSRMVQIGILDTSVNDVSVVMTRGQFAKSVVIADDLIDDASGMEGATIFGDIAPYSDLSGYVNILLNKHLISGMPDGKFHPEAGITYSEFCTDLVRLLGYTDSDLIGTWPSNYLGKAQSLKISDNLAFKKNDKITMGAAAVMFDRLLDTDVKNDSTNGTTKVTFTDSLNLNPDYAEYLILGNSKTSDNLGDSEVLTDKGIFTYSAGVDPLEIGGKYQLYVDDNEITEIEKKENSTENFVVTEKTGVNMKWQNDKDEVNSIELPKATVYYYHGKTVNYNAAVAAINVFSSVILSKSSGTNVYEYAVIIDPYFSTPRIYRSGDYDFWSEIQNSEFSYVYKDEMYTMNPFSISDHDVVYFVSDIWNKNTYIYATNKTVYGHIESFAPSKVNASSVTINKETYDFNQYFDKTKLNSYYTGSTINLIIGVDGKIVDIY